MPKPLEELKKVRLEKLNKLRQKGIDPFPATWEKLGERVKTETCSELSLESEVTVAGRIMSWRGHGKIIFADLRDDCGQIQLCFKSDDLPEADFELLKLFDLGDFLGVQGKLFKTKAGELTILVKDFKLLTKSLRPLPSEWYGLEDKEIRYRQRYLDLILNPEVRRKFEIRTELIKLIREFLHKKHFIEFETPTIQPLYGGTNARPFSTHINALDQDMYLRIADELYLKRLVVGGFERVFEICKDFRNEGIDQTHQPEFTMIEYYQAYADYQEIIQLTENLIKYCAEQIFGQLELEVGEKKIDLSGRWNQMTIRDAMKKFLQIDYAATNKEELTNLLSEADADISGNENINELFFKVFDNYIPPKLIEPTWVIDYPAEVSPLSKQKEDEPNWVERFEGYIGGKEICDGWSEINDPLEQRKRFEADQGKEDAHPIDEGFIEALEYGMPPLGGIGIGIDRLTMFFTNTWSIKEVILFPMLRRKE